MHKPTHIFVATLVLFAAGTSAIGYSLASDSYNAAKPVSAAFTVIDMKSIPWYCVSAQARIKGQGVDDRSGYYPSGYNQSGYNTLPSSGYNAQRTPPTAGYVQPGYQLPAKPGYQVDAISPRDYQTVTPPANLQANQFNTKWQASLPSCPKGYKFDEALVITKCSVALQKKLDGNPLPAESKEQYATCQKILKTNIWNAKISQNICSAFYQYENDCVTSQKNKRACKPLSKYLIAAGVSKAGVPKTQSDTIYLCKDVYPKP